MKRVRLGRLHADHVTFADALDRIAELVAAGNGGYVVTPNVDHVVLAEEDRGLRRAYREASLSLVDGKPLLWMSRLLKHPLPEKLSGSDLLEPLVALAAANDWGVYFLGAAPGVGQQAADILSARHSGLRVVGVDAPPVGFEGNPEQSAAVLQGIRAARPQLVFVALGCPKQELWMHRERAQLSPAVALGIGASLDFIAGKARRSPRWMSHVGLEWLYRLGQEPRRMYQRYLVRDRAIASIFWKMLQMPVDERAYRIAPRT